MFEVTDNPNVSWPSTIVSVTTGTRILLVKGSKLSTSNSAVIVVALKSAPKCITVVSYVMDNYIRQLGITCSRRWCYIISCDG